jgi:UDP-2,3-diacylglucosamine hydrolase
MSFVLNAPGHWRTLDFLSDVHLQASEPETFEAWKRHLLSATCDALFILGDLFEVWVGDDVLDHPTHGLFWRECAQVLRQACLRHPVYFMVGNRDFLAGNRLLAETGMTGLSDPTVLSWGHERWLLSHGDALCLADEPYQRFRQQVRDAAWMQAFLQRPLQERLQLAQGMRQASEQRKTTDTNWADVEPSAALQALLAHDCTRLIHGHTHQPAMHWLDATHSRHVLSDWAADAQPPRLQVLRARLGDPCGVAPDLVSVNLQ